MAEASSTVSAPLRRGLPDEIAVWEILVRLPPKSLLRCRAVCREWRRATYTRGFLLAHHDRQPCLPVPVIYNYDCFTPYLDIVSINRQAGVAAADQLQSIAFLEASCDADLDLEASCDGLLIVSNSLRRSRRFSICNPATRQYAPLPQISGFIILGMYPHHNTGEYRLLLYPEPVDEDACYVFALGSRQPPRNIDIECPDAMKYAPVPVLFCGNLHWHLKEYESGTNLIMVFDTTAESFRQMRSPVRDCTSLLFEMDNMLAMYNYNDAATTIDIWVSRDYENQLWAFKCQIELPVEEIRVQFQKFDRNWDVMVRSYNDDVLVLVRFGEWLLQINIDGKLVASFHREGLGLTPLLLKQTLVPHTFFPTLEGYVVNDSPFI